MEYRIDKSGIVWNKDQYMREMQSHKIHYSIDQIQIMWNNLKPIEITTYDSKADTLDHIKMVNGYMINSAKEVLTRAEKHDSSKLSGLEKDIFDQWTPILSKLEYGSEGYKESLKSIKPALDNHYKYNSHHPEHYENGVDGMDLFDVIEMLNDWKAATQRTSFGDIKKSLQINKDRFNISDQLYNIMLNTVNRYVWLNRN